MSRNQILREARLSQARLSRTKALRENAGHEGTDVKALSVSLVVFLCAGCAGPQGGSGLANNSGPVAVLQVVQQGLGQLKGGLERASSASVTAAQPSSFKGLLAGDAGVAWPRVAVTIHRLPPNAYAPAVAQMMGRAVPPSLCMTVSAVVWTDTKNSRSIPEEPFCPSQAPAKWVGYTAGEFLLWSGTPAQGAHTGAKRGSGPLPQRLAFPEGAKYGNFLNSNGSWLFQALLATMAFDVSASPGQDRRLWVISLPAETDL